MIQSVESRFEDRLLAELKQVVAQRSHSAGSAQPAASRPPVPRRRLVLAGAVGAMGVAATALVTLTPGGGVPAYAMSTSDDGTVVVTANYLGDPAEVNAELRRAGVPAVVLPAVPAAQCPAADRGSKVPGHAGGQGATILVTNMGLGKHVQVRWTLDSVPDGTLLVLSPQLDDATGEMVMTIDHFYEPGPRCIVKGIAGLVPVPRESINNYEPIPPGPAPTQPPPAFETASPGAVPVSPGAQRDALTHSPG
ncbi:hypothetical protein [Phytohabitans rumicis]|uniref:hypothetical protein n=1 Tax=Phytohabitans rumicis TaxID=1076125 RepID=UPI0031EB57D2